MSDGRIKILEESLKYLKYFRDNKNYAIYENELAKNTELEESVIFNHSENIPVKEVLNPEPELNYNKNDAVKEKIKRDPVLKINENWNECTTLDSFANEISNCQKCRLLPETRKQIVFGTGNHKADIVVVGEAPGADEDSQGKPFVGRAGKLLTEILKAINLDREDVYICNILKCRPPENRNPLPDEINNCEPYLFKQLEMIKPKLILAVGTFAAQTLLQSKEPLGKLRGRFHIYKGIKMMVTYHPAALLRNPNWKRPTWEDVKMLRNEYDNMLKN